ncbi:hypothetical protein WJX84_006436, partial [Apatococcus fuscideae]
EDLADLRAEHVALSEQLKHSLQLKEPADQHVKQELSKQLTALSSQVVHLQNEARQPGVVVAAGAMEFMRISSKVGEAVGSVLDIFKQGMPFGRKDRNE